MNLLYWFNGFLLYSSIGLIFISYKTTKTLKKNVDLAVDRLEAKFEEQLDKDPVSKNAPRKRRTTLSPFEAGMMVIANENTTRMLMQFWILYGIFNFLIQYNIIYSEELRILVIFLIILPSFANIFQSLVYVRKMQVWNVGNDIVETEEFLVFAYDVTIYWNPY